MAVEVESGGETVWLTVLVAMVILAVEFCKRTSAEIYTCMTQHTHTHTHCWSLPVLVGVKVGIALVVMDTMDVELGMGGSADQSLT